ncbi:hypothetical protein AALP_AA8G175700 [Arabis alpina]|uniref:Uncharacterized protein n=1 Tax=Arabis alpina TaxID=50452 RepID=A0A087G7N9_ARAAL|nr:hypothetical protein AALP_AA8G175700 [Arabis alpina]
MSSSYQIFSLGEHAYFYAHTCGQSWPFIKEENNVELLL